ncbi:MAG: four helix bundle protein [Ignavibacteriae bacterium]|nr:MAG: four helix bundle protein [Ignavibacteriota bacterium]
MNSEELKQRTKKFAVSVFKFTDTLDDKKLSSRVIAKQLSRAGSSIGANYRAACKGRSRSDFISKITIVEEESDECIYWLEILKELKSGEEIILDSLLKEAREFTAIFTASGKTAKENKL